MISEEEKEEEEDHEFIDFP
jgi:hypothetical protein